MKNLLTKNRASTKILKDLFKLRKKLLIIEKSSQSYDEKIGPLLRKDYWLSHALIKVLSYENNFDIKFKTEAKFPKKIFILLMKIMVI